MLAPQFLQVIPIDPIVVLDPIEPVGIEPIPPCGIAEEPIEGPLPKKATAPALTIIPPRSASMERIPRIVTPVGLLGFGCMEKPHGGNSIYKIFYPAAI